MLIKTDILSGFNVSSSLRLCLFPSPCLCLCHATPLGQDLKWVTDLCLIDPHMASIVICFQSMSHDERLNVSFGSQAEKV